jgi:hypothetical protein
MDGEFWRLTLSGIIVSWPGIAVSVWLAYRGVKKHVSSVTRQQTTVIENLTDAQTQALLSGPPERPGA